MQSSGGLTATKHKKSSASRIRFKNPWSTNPLISEPKAFLWMAAFIFYSVNAVVAQ